MSNKERLVQLAEGVPENQATLVFFMIKHYLNALEDLEDEIFCKHLLEQALADPDKGDTISIEEFAAQLGVSLE